MVQEIWKLLEGRKTFLISILWLLSGFGLSIGVLTKDQYDAITAVLFPAGLATLRMGVSK